VGAALASPKVARTARESGQWEQPWLQTQTLQPRSRGGATARVFGSLCPVWSDPGDGAFVRSSQSPSEMGAGHPTQRLRPALCFCLVLGVQLAAVAEVLCRDSWLLDMVSSGYLVVEFEAAR